MLGNEIALNFTKDEILDMYVNRIFYGNFAVGVGSAAELYFHVPADKLDLAQASMLAGLPQSPTSYNPLLHSADETINPVAKSRQKAVLQAMQASGYITQAEGIAAYDEKLTVYSVDDVGTELRPRLHQLPRDLPERELPRVREPRRLRDSHHHRPGQAEPRSEHRHETRVRGTRQGEHGRRRPGEPGPPER